MVRRAPPRPQDASRPGAADAAAQLRFKSVKQIAEYLQINEKKVYSLAAEGRIPGTKVTGKWLFPRDLVDQWLVESSHGGVLTDRLVVAGSDDPLLARAVARLAGEIEARALVAYSSTGTGLGLSLLAAGRADACAIHWGPAEESHVRHPALLSRHAGHHQWVLARAFRREQGLVVARRTRRADLSPEALLGGKRRWAFRQSGAGSQRFLEDVLATRKIAADTLQCVATARSESEAAALVSMGDADVAPGVRAAATQADLPFVALGWEAFDFALYRGIYFRALFQRLMDELKSESTRTLADRLGGYDLAELGKLVWAGRN